MGAGNETILTYAIDKLYLVITTSISICLKYTQPSINDLLIHFLYFRLCVRTTSSSAGTTNVFRPTGDVTMRRLVVMCLSFYDSLCLYV